MLSITGWNPLGWLRITAVEEVRVMLDHVADVDEEEPVGDQVEAEKKTGSVIAVQGGGRIRSRA